MKRLIVIPLYEMMGWNQIYMLLFVLCVVAMRYGALTFVLSRTVKRHSNREKIDALFSIGILALVFWQHRDEIFHTTYGHIGLNILYVLLAIVVFYAVNIIVGEKLGGVKIKEPAANRETDKRNAFCHIVMLYGDIGSYIRGSLLPVLHTRFGIRKHGGGDPRGITLVCFHASAYRVYCSRPTNLHGSFYCDRGALLSYRWIII